MQTIKDIAIEFANEAYSWYDEPNINKLKQEYINDIIEYDFCMDWSDNKSWEAWYIRWYEVALKELTTVISDSNNYTNIWDVILQLDYLLTN